MSSWVRHQRSVVLSNSAGGVADVVIGMQDIEFAAHWRLAEPSGDLIVNQYVTNTGTTPVNLVVYVSAPGMPRQQRAIGVLDPGQTATRDFRFVNGAQRLAGKDVYLGIIERGGARLNRVLSIPPLPDAVATGR